MGENYTNTIKIRCIWRRDKYRKRTYTEKKYENRHEKKIYTNKKLFCKKKIYMEKNI